jgi:ATP phosphoribosyltransferase regulatory subunit
VGTKAKAALERLKTVYAQLRRYGLEKKVLMDLGETRGFDYYTGILFEIFIEGMGESIGGGGRYDTLMGKFGNGQPATGFALDLDRIQDAMVRSDLLSPLSNLDVVLVNGDRGSAQMLDLALLLRRRGIRAVFWPGGDTSRAVTYARANGFARVIARSGKGQKPYRLVSGTVRERSNPLNENDVIRLLTARHE